jgi:mannose-6-phosphate isomerase
MPSRDVQPYPVRFEPIYKEKVWGGRRLEKLGRQLPGGAQGKIGESWELTDLQASSVSGGGGGQERSVIANGPWAGRTLHDVIHEYGPRLMGRLRPTPTGDFPLLVKFVDAFENLSLQVHPSEEYARTHPDAHLKSEAWYIVHADPGAVIYKGVKPGVTPEPFREALRIGGVEDLLIRVPVKPGECHSLPSGTCHAMGAGVLVAEVQTPSDTTFRVYDWGRVGRPMHIDQAMQCIEWGPPDVRRYEQRSHIAGFFTTVTRLVTCEHFRIDKVRMTQGYEQEIPYDQPAVWVVLEGKGKMTPRPDAPPIPFEKGQTWLLPSGMDEARIALDENTAWLEVTFPQALAEQIA